MCQLCSKQYSLAPIHGPAPIHGFAVYTSQIISKIEHIIWSCCIYRMNSTDFVNIILLVQILAFCLDLAINNIIDKQQCYNTSLKRNSYTVLMYQCHVYVIFS